MAALVALGIWDAEIRTDGGEVPALDGSAREFTRALLQSSEPDRPGPRWRVARPFTHRNRMATCHLMPHADADLVLECAVGFPHPMIGRQHGRISGRSALDRFIGARTFGFWDEASVLRCQGLARGADLANTVVFDRKRVLNPGGLRYSDEPVRHKIVDALGDLALLGRPLVGRVRLERPGHRLLQETLLHAVAAGVLESQT